MPRRISMRARDCSRRYLIAAVASVGVHLLLALGLSLHLQIGLPALRYPESPLQIVEFEVADPPAPARAITRHEEIQPPHDKPAVPAESKTAPEVPPEPAGAPNVSQLVPAADEVMAERRSPKLHPAHPASKTALTPKKPFARAALSKYTTEVRDRIASHRFYPEEARRMWAEGKVVLEISIKPDGRLEGIHIAESSGFKELDRAARMAARFASPYPPPPAGGSRRVRLRIPITYRLETS